MIEVRDATAADAEKCAAIYAPCVRGTAVSFETVPPSGAEIAERIAAAHQTYAWLVAEDEGEVVGYAYGAPYKTRPAYRWSVEVSVYVADGRRGSGVGRTVYEALLARLAERGFRRAVAGMTLPNDASVRLHTALGFAPVGVFHRIGWKLGAWHDVQVMQRALSELPDLPAEPR